MECKETAAENEAQIHSRFNRNIVECKVLKHMCLIHSVLVLIETLWNVKDINISTINALVACFNRNIVECKGAMDPKWWFTEESFNRNIVECKVE